MRRGGCWRVAGMAMMAIPSAVHGESVSAEGHRGLSASASIMFQIVIPPMLGLRVSEGLPPLGATRVSIDPAAPTLRGARTGLALDIPARGASSNVLLRSNMRQITVLQDDGPRPVVTVAAP